MKKMISLLLIGFTLASCSLLRIHKLDVEQGNVFTQENVEKLRVGMTESEVKEVMGTPVLINIFTPNRIDYIYTLEPGHGRMSEKRLALIFQGGRLQEIRRE